VRTSQTSAAPHHCETEMAELRWCDAQEFLAALDGYGGGEAITLPSLGAPFRRWTTKYYLGLTRSIPFRAFCLQKELTGLAAGDVATGGAAGDADGKLLQELLGTAKASGSQPAAWQQIFARLSRSPGIASQRAGRSFSLLHHAAFWGQSDAAARLVSDFQADVLLRSRDGETAADVAARRGHADSAEFLRSAVQAAQQADLLLSLAKRQGAQADAWEQIFAHLSESPFLVDQRSGRSYGLLHHAAHWGQLPAARRLLNDYHANARLRTRDGLTAAEIAVNQSHPALAQYLLEQLSTPAESA